MLRSVLLLAAMLLGCAHAPAPSSRWSDGSLPERYLSNAPATEAVRPDGYVVPRTVVPGCVERLVRVPQELAGFSSAVLVKFAVGADGRPGRFQVLDPQQPSPEIADALWSAVSGCAWIPGRDPGGKPVAVWVVLPVRFVR